jgi:hypothetical protein
VVYTQNEKEQTVLQHFNNLFGSPKPRTHTVNWDMLDLQSQNLSHFEEQFSVEQAREMINDLTMEKTPGSDGYIGIFYIASWEIIKHDIMGAVNYFYNQHD